MISDIFARSIFDSRGNPTVEIDLFTEDGMMFRSAVPSGASTGIYEAVELRDGVKTEYKGKGVSKAVHNVNSIIKPALIAKKFEVTQQTEIDAFLNSLDGTPNKSVLGANAILGVSMAVCKAGAHASKVPLYMYINKLANKDSDTIVMPVPCFNVINGGSHAGNALAFQEFMILPTQAKSFSEAMKIGSEIYHTLKDVIKKKYGLDATAIGDEGGFAPNVLGTTDALDLLMDAIKTAGYENTITIAMDVAASEFLIEENGNQLYDLGNKASKEAQAEQKLKLTGKELCDFYRDLVQKYPIKSIEDPFDQDDWEHWTMLTASIGKEIQIVGDDLTVTNVERIKTAIDKNSCNALLLKINQIGTITESIQAVKMAHDDGKWGVMASHRSGETEDTFIADLCVGLRTGQIKTGAPCRSERLAKYNQLLRIEEEATKMGKKVVYAGASFRTTH